MLIALTVNCQNALAFALSQQPRPISDTRSAYVSTIEELRPTTFSTLGTATIGAHDRCSVIVTVMLLVVPTLYADAVGSASVMVAFNESFM